MTLEEYEHRFLGELTDNYEGGQHWHDYVIDCYREHMDSVAEQELEMELNQL